MLRAGSRTPARNASQSPCPPLAPQETVKRRRRGVCGWCRTAAQTRMSSRPVSPFLDLDLLLLARHLRRFRQADAQHAIVELGLDLRRVGMERQWDRAAERAIAAFHHVPVLILVLLV